MIDFTEAFSSSSAATTIQTQALGRATGLYFAGARSNY